MATAPPSPRPLRVLIPRGMARLATQSGIGEAIRHQQRAVSSLGHQVVTNPFGPFDAVHLNTPFPDTPLLAALAHLRRRPILVWAHSTEDDFRDSFTGANRLAPWFRRWIAAIYRRGDAVITPTEYARTLISDRRYGIRQPIHVLSNGVDTAFFSPRPGARAVLRERFGLPLRTPVVMCVGLLMVRKGILEWVETARAMPHVTFLWYGRTDPRLITAEVAAEVAAAPPNALFPGYVSREVLREAYSGADAFCFLTKEETEGIVLLEALSCGAPTLLADIPIYGDWLPDGEVVHKVPVPRAKDVSSGAPFAREHLLAAASVISARLQALLDGELADLRNAGRRAAEEVDMRPVAQRLQEIYDASGVTARSR
ncbi:glycosyltransferase family 4 protein [Brachybacterium sp. JHP9]|uniref:D-inositol 3-phosphate glycosyltransferase n=1 Tax=Brachybacterium equifaecis TaxID=2910770 RepID=A0ABT0QW55_9MICO|nr:glycosyltransferase family 4 protein [Brachybacterium equifaecis]MCL6421897.1 glycosyltransferase family 4 protein [Brachybacterium equifaecis]